MPDLDLLMEMSDFYGVDLRELLDGERKNKSMDKEVEETVRKVAEYSNAEKEKTTRMMRTYFILGTAALILNGAMEVLEIGGTFWIGFAKGATFGLALCAMVFGILYTSGYMAKIFAAKKRMFGRMSGQNRPQ